MASFRELRNSFLQNTGIPQTGSDTLNAGMNALQQGTAQALAYSQELNRLAAQQQQQQPQQELSARIAALGESSGVPPEVVSQAIATGAIPNPTAPNSMAGYSSGVAANVGSGVASPTLINLLNKHEGAGNYDTLFGHSQKNGPFAGVRVSDMSVADVMKFSDPKGAYGQWVKQELGRMGHNPRVATPMGAGQIVGSTLRNSVKALGIDPNTKFDANTQNQIINHLALQRIRGARDLNSAIGGLRAEWEGFARVPNQTLAQVVRELGGRW